MTETILERIRRWWRCKRECARQDRRMHIWDDLRIKDRARVQAEQIVDEQTARIRKKLERDAELREQELRSWTLETVRKEIDRAKEDLRREIIEAENRFGVWEQAILRRVRKDREQQAEELREEMRQEIRAAYGMDAPERTERPGVSGVSPHH